MIAFDEFRSSLRIKEMLIFCDIYPIDLPSRYTNKYACYNKVYIISNLELEKQYYEIQREDKESWDAFLRRIHKVVICAKDGSINGMLFLEESIKLLYALKMEVSKNMIQ